MEENEIRLAKMKELIAQTERKLQKCFIEKGIKSLAGI